MRQVMDCAPVVTAGFVSYTQNFSEIPLLPPSARSEFPYQSFNLYNYGPYNNGDVQSVPEMEYTYVYGNATWGTGDVQGYLTLQPYALL